MVADLDMSEYLDLFVQEAEERLATLERELLLLEREPTTERIDLVFRAAHTLKGSSRAMGFAGVADLTHEMESVLDALRGHSLQVSTEVANALLAGLDELRVQIESIVGGRGDIPSDPNLVARMQRFLGTPAPLTPSGDLTPEIAEALGLATVERPVMRARIVLNTDCVMKYVRAFMAIQAVGDAGELLASVPDAEGLEDEAFDREFTLFFHSNESQEGIETRLRAVGEIAELEVEFYRGSSLRDHGDAGFAEPIEETALPKGSVSSTVRVEVARLDELMNLMGELAIDRARLSGIGAALAARYAPDEHLEALAETSAHLARIAADLQDGLMKTRMMPIDTVFNRFPRMVRDLAQSLGKEVELEIRGGETELDRSVLETIGDPLIHILRNSIDHGLERPDERGGKPRQGRLVLSARHQESHIIIEVEDDGRGIDAERLKSKAVASGLLSPGAAERMGKRDAVNLIFSNGFSTAEHVSEVSGRGVGMDIVRSNLQKLGGLVDVETEVGKGTKFTLRLPLTLAIIRGLLVRVANVVYVMPVGSVIEAQRIPRADIQTVAGREVVVIRDNTVPLVRLRKIFGRDEAALESSSEAVYVVVVGVADRRLGLVVDCLLGEQEVVIKSLNRFCGEVRGISGATILGDGKVALIVDVNGIVSEAAL